MVEALGWDLPHDRAVAAGQLHAAVGRSRVDDHQLDRLAVLQALLGDRPQAARQVLAPVLDGDHDRDRHGPLPCPTAAPSRSRRAWRRPASTSSVAWSQVWEATNSMPSRERRSHSWRSSSSRCMRVGDPVGVERGQLQRAVGAEDRLGADARELDAGQAAGEHLLGHQREVRQRQAQADGGFGVEPGELRGVEHVDVLVGEGRVEHLVGRRTARSARRAAGA